MKYTKNYNFLKPEDNDFFNVAHFDEMMDQVDDALYRIENGSNLYIGGNRLSSEATIKDTAAEYTVLSKTSSSVADMQLFSVGMSLKLGTYAVMIRMKVSDVSKNENMIRVRFRKGSANGDIIKTIYISPAAFEANDRYKIIGTILDMENMTKGTNIYIEAAIGKTNATETVTVDYVLINPAYTSVSAV
ncbi:MAG: hypothetical protein MSD68_04735 [Blautia sp.]|uniref:hypothetical protein n=1 Tax=Blautia sp. TaxID=1955243 RepID=UPI0025BDCF8C|nr:hypothetical protein [Blautia sp.]MCI7449016.1 hypothetical protein [Blautia sp.]